MGKQDLPQHSKATLEMSAGHHLEVGDVARLYLAHWESPGHKAGGDTVTESTHTVSQTCWLHSVPVRSAWQALDPLQWSITTLQLHSAGTFPFECINAHFICQAENSPQSRSFADLVLA